MHNLDGHVYSVIKSESYNCKLACDILFMCVWQLCFMDSANIVYTTRQFLIFWTMAIFICFLTMSKIIFFFHDKFTYIFGISNHPILPWKFYYNIHGKFNLKRSWKIFTFFFWSWQISFMDNGQCSLYNMAISRFFWAMTMFYCLFEPWRNLIFISHGSISHKSWCD